KFNPNGSLAYSTYIDGAPSGALAGSDAAYGVAVDALGNAYIVGHSDTPPFAVTATLDPSGAKSGGYVLVLDATGMPTRATILSGNVSFDFIALGGDGSSYVSGTAFGPINFATVNAMQPNRGDNTDGIAGRLNAAG